jgi:hypothetical protein
LAAACWEARTVGMVPGQCYSSAQAGCPSVQLGRKEVHKREFRMVAEPDTKVARG